MKCVDETCPRCGASSPCFDHIEVDIGVGVMTGEHEYMCPEHGLFAYSEIGVVFRDEPDARTPHPSPERSGETE